MPVDKNITILLVDDAGVIRMVAKKTLNELGFNNVVEAEDGEKAIDIIRDRTHPDLVISDWNMPVKTGLDLLRWLRSIDLFDDIPFIMATARGEKKNVDEAKKYGVNSFVTKPFSAAELNARIEEAFGNPEPLKALLKREELPRMTQAGKVRLRVAHEPVTDHIVLGAMKYFIQAGDMVPKIFELQTKTFDNPNLLSEALEQGLVDAACIQAPLALDMIHSGVPMKIILFANKNGSVFVRNKMQQAYTEPHEDFFKKKSCYIPHHLSVHHLLAHMFFEGIGLKPGVAGPEELDVTFEVVTPDKMPEFLSGDTNVGGYLVTEPLGTKAIASGVADFQFLSSELWQNHPGSVVVVRQELIDQYAEAVQDFTNMLVKAGGYVMQKPAAAAEIAVKFLDPNRVLALKIPLLKDVLSDERGIKTDDLFPVVEDLKFMQEFIRTSMEMGEDVDVDAAVDLRFAQQAIPEAERVKRKSLLKNTEDNFSKLLADTKSDYAEQTAKSMLNKEGKYLMFKLDDQFFGVDILQIIEISRMQQIRSIPQSPKQVLGVINFRGKVIPVIDPRKVFGLPDTKYSDDAYIIVIELEYSGGTVLSGLIVDFVSEILAIEAKNIEEAPDYVLSVDSRYILGMAKIEDKYRILIDIDQILKQDEIKKLEQIA